MRNLMPATLLAALLSVPVPPALCDTTAEDGARFAAEKCGRCHAVRAGEDSPHTIAPSFMRFQEAYPIDMLVEARRTGIVAGHDEMPMFEFTPDEIRALLLHIDTLAPDRPGYIERVPPGTPK